MVCTPDLPGGDDYKFDTSRFAFEVAQLAALSGNSHNTNTRGSRTESEIAQSYTRV